MIRNSVRLGAMGAIVATSVLAGATTATADPVNAPRSFNVPLVCGNGAHYTVAVMENNGQFSAAHDVASTRTLIPTAFGPFHGVLTDTAGNVVDEFTDPAVSKGGSPRPRKTSVHCTFRIVQTFTIPELGTVTFHGTGSVTGFVTPAR